MDVVVHTTIAFALVRQEVMSEVRVIDLIVYMLVGSKRSIISYSTSLAD